MTAIRRGRDPGVGAAPTAPRRALASRLAVVTLAGAFGTVACGAPDHAVPTATSAAATTVALPVTVTPTAGTRPAPSVPATGPAVTSVQGVPSDWTAGRVTTTSAAACTGLWNGADGTYSPTLVAVDADAGRLRWQSCPARPESGYVAAVAQDGRGRRRRHDAARVRRAHGSRGLAAPRRPRAGHGVGRVRDPDRTRRLPVVDDDRARRSNRYRAVAASWGGLARDGGGSPPQRSAPDAGAWCAVGRSLSWGTRGWRGPRSSRLPVQRRRR